MSRQITASMLYDLVQCEKRVELDNSGDPSLRDKINPFIQMLWDRGALFEKETIQQLEMPFEDLSAYSLDIKEQKTYEAMDRKDALIYGGRISSDELLGDPDLLKLEGDKYIAGDIKSGGAEDVFDDDRKPKQHYAAQVALYTDILERKGYSAGRKAFIWDIHGDEVVYDLNMSRGSRIKQTMWEEYVSLLNNAKLIIQNGKTAKGALASKCKMCYWYSVCSKDLAEKDDLTLIPELGRALRDCMEQDFPTVQQLSESNPDNYIRGRKTTIKGLGPDRLVRFHKRAELLKSKHPKPEVITPVSLPKTECEIFFDIEVDPMRDVCYLHGFIERDGNGEKFHAFYADNPTAEEEKFAFQSAWGYIKDKKGSKIYYYSKYERTIWRKLQSKYPDVCTPNDIEDLFNPECAVDLYTDVVKSKIEWPTHNKSIKTLAVFHGFKWRDIDPSGAASIEWYNQWVETKDPEIKRRILEYNEDDCKATYVLLDGIRELLCS